MSGPAQQTYTIHFDQEVYVVQPGQSFRAVVRLDPQASAGLFSYAVELLVEESKARVSSLSAITVPAQLDFNGVLGPGAHVALGAGFAGAKGTVDFFAVPIKYYAGADLAAFVISDLSGTLGEYPLRLRGFNTLGPTESLFVTGDGQVLDRFITFQGAMVRVIPEPNAWVLLGFGGAIFWGALKGGARRRRSGTVGCPEVQRR